MEIETLEYILKYVNIDPLSKSLYDANNKCYIYDVFDKIK